MITIKNLCYRYDSEEGDALRGIDISIEDRTYLAVIGPNGSGKTTFLKHLNGLLTPTGGDVWIDGLNTRDKSTIHEVRRRVGMVFQNPDHQIVGMSVEEDVAFGPGNLNMRPDDIRKRVAGALDTLNLTAFAHRSPHTLSNGEKQLVAIAGVLAMNPRYMALDEPNAFLDPSARMKILDVINDLHGRGMTLIHATHSMEEIARADRVLVLNGGEIALEGSPRDVFAQGERLQSLGLVIPLVTELMNRLNRIGASVRSDVFTLDEACDELSAYVKRTTPSGSVLEETPGK